FIILFVRTGFETFSQTSAIELITSKDIFDEREDIKLDHIKKYYAPTSSDGEKTILFNDLEISLSLYRVDTVVWDKDTRTISTQMIFAQPQKSHFIEVSKWNQKGSLVYSSKTNTKIETDSKDVEKIYNYDDLNRLT